MCYIKYGDYIMQTKLYRNLYELIHPSISRENITGYSIILKEGILPIKVFYPKIGVELNRIILYLPDARQKIDFYKRLAEELDSVILLVEVGDQKGPYTKTIEYVKKELEKCSIKSPLIVIADGYCCDILNSINSNALKKIYLNPQQNIELDQNSIILTNNEAINGDNIFKFNGEFLDAMNDNGLAIREMIFSTLRNFIEKN